MNQSHGHTFPAGETCLSIDHVWIKRASGTSCPLCAALVEIKELKAVAKQERKKGIREFAENVKGEIRHHSLSGWVDVNSQINRIDAELAKLK